MNERQPDMLPIRVLNLFLRYRVTMWSLPLLATLVVVIYGTIQPTTYTATAAFLPEAPPANRSALSGLASELGLALVNTFNLERRQSRAAQEKRFVETRRTEARDELQVAEDRLKSFLERNRDYRNSPQLVFDQERLAREVALRQQLLTSLSQAYEQARIDEVRDTPVITV